MIDHKDGIMQFQKWFLEEMIHIKDTGRMFTFPVNTISLLTKDGDFVDEDFAKWCCEKNMKWNDSNFFTDTSVTSLSNCCRLKSSIDNLGYFKTKEEKISEDIMKEMYQEYIDSQGENQHEKA